MTSRGSPTLVTVVMPVLNGASTLSEQLSALAGQTLRSSWELLVVDNGSTDGSVELVRAFSDRLGLRVTHEPRRGVSFARNRGAREARGELLAFCDADDVVQPQWLERLVDAARHHDMVGGRLEDRQLNSDQVVRWRGELPEDGVLRPGGWLASAPGGNCAVWRDTALAVGLWDPAFVAGSDDVDFCWRVQLAGYELGWAPDAVLHYRYRAEIRAVLRQFLTYGRTEALLYRRFAASGMPRRSLRTAARAYAGLLLRLVMSCGRRDPLIAALRDASYCLGRLEGSLQQRVRFL